MERTKENTVPIITTDEWIGKTEVVRAAAKEHNRNVERIKGFAALVERHDKRQLTTNEKTRRTGR